MAEWYFVAIELFGDASFREGASITLNKVYYWRSRRVTNLNESECQGIVCLMDLWLQLVQTMTNPLPLLLSVSICRRKPSIISRSIRGWLNEWNGREFRWENELPRAVFFKADFRVCFINWKSSFHLLLAKHSWILKVVIDDWADWPAFY